MIKQQIHKYIAANFDRYHTPGHGGELCAADITELDNGDYFPSNSIELAQNATAQIFGAKHLRFLVNGSSIGIKAAIMAVGGDIISAKNSHQAVQEGASLARVENFTIDNIVKNGLSEPLTIQQISSAISNYPSAKAVVITSPDYYGNCCDTAVAELVHSCGLILIADSAHGAHFAGSSLLKHKSFAASADFCNMSAHKTLNAYTQTAYLAINNCDLLPQADNALKLLGTTSPNYVFMQQLEIAAIELQASEQKYALIYEWIQEFKQKVKCAHSDDFTRLVVDSFAINMTGKLLSRELIKSKIMPEMQDDRYVVFIITPRVTHEMLIRLTTVILAVCA